MGQRMGGRGVPQNNLIHLLYLAVKGVTPLPLSCVPRFVSFEFQAGQGTHASPRDILLMGRRVRPEVWGFVLGSHAKQIFLRRFSPGISSRPRDQWGIIRMKPPSEPAVAGITHGQAPSGKPQRCRVVSPHREFPRHCQRVGSDPLSGRLQEDHSGYRMRPILTRHSVPQSRVGFLLHALSVSSAPLPLRPSKRATVGSPAVAKKPSPGPVEAPDGLRPPCAHQMHLPLKSWSYPDPHLILPGKPSCRHSA